MNQPFRVECDVDNLKKIRAYLRKQLKELLVPESARNLMLVAIDETCANLIIHANRQDKSQHLELQVARQKDGVVFEIRDQGLAFDPTSYLEPSIREIVKRRRKGGVGVMLVRRIMDRIEYHRYPDHNVCRLFKRLTSDGEAAE